MCAQNALVIKLFIPFVLFLQVNDVVRFELNQKQLTGLLSQVKDVQTAIESRTQI